MNQGLENLKRQPPTPRDFAGRSEPAAAPQSLFFRLLWFGAGGVLSYTLNVSCFLLLTRHLGLSQRVAYACSLALITGVTFGWSYLVNFRTSRSLQSCLKRYVATLVICYGLNYLMAHVAFAFWPDKPKLIILVVLVIIAGVKFLIYHWWVFPRVTER
jgi:putative flippase GtrA